MTTKDLRDLIDKMDCEREVTVEIEGYSFEVDYGANVFVNHLSSKKDAWELILYLKGENDKK